MIRMSKCVNFVDQVTWKAKKMHQNIHSTILYVDWRDMAWVEIVEVSIMGGRKFMTNCRFFRKIEMIMTEVSINPEHLTERVQSTKMNKYGSK